MQIVSERDFVIRRWRDFYDLDWYILGPVIILVLVSLVLLKSVAGGFYLPKQLMLLLIAILFSVAVLFLKIDSLKHSAIWIYWLNVLFLFIVLIKGASALGAQRWLDLGIIRFQPSEVAKIAIVISLAAWFNKYPIKSYKDIFISMFVIIPPFLLIFKQPDLGTSLTFVAIYLAMAFWAGATITYLLVVLSPVISLITNSIGNVVFNFGTQEVSTKIIELTITQYFIYFLLFLVLWLLINLKPWKSPWVVLKLSFIVFCNFVIGFIRPILWSYLHPYQQRRLTIFLNPESDPQGAGYHIIQSLLAVGNGGIFGYGWQHGRLTKGDYVPAQHTDFIFSTAGEEFGFLGAAFLVIIFAVILTRTIYIAKYSNDKFASFLAIGIFSFIAFHFFVNIGMTLGIMPVTGVPLPLVSYGGTALVVDMFSLFLLLSISWRTLPKRMF